MVPHPSRITDYGLSGRIAALFIGSKLTPLIIVGALLLGLFAVVLTPREEEPQILVPMVDVFLPFPGASAKVVEEQLTKPIERKISEIKGVEYLYSLSRPGGALLIVRFYVGEPLEQSLVDLYDKLMSNQDLLPPGAGPFQVKPRDINDVPIVTITLSSERYSEFHLRRLAQHVLEEVKKVPNTSGGFIVGGSRRELRVHLDPSRLKAYGVTPLHIASVIQGENLSLPAGRFQSENRDYVVETGRFIGSREDLESLVVGVSEGRPIYLRQVATVIDGPSETTSYMWFGVGPSAREGLHESPAVTVAIAKQAHTNAVTVARDVVRKVEELKGTVLPADVRVTVTRDYGETADEKANELLWHLLIAVAAVVVFLGVALGPRPALVVSIAIPLTLALTLFTSMVIGYTINRVTLFALIFSIGILVDDAIVVVENIYRHLMLRILPHREAAIRAVDEVGNPTILATFTVIAALLPMAFVSGLMGPYMRPIPVNASMAMFFSLLVAFVVVPWFCQKCYREGGEGLGVRGEGAATPPGQDRTYRLYQRLLSPVLAHPLIAFAVLAAVGLLLLASLTLFYTRAVAVKMLPFDNKSELQLVIDMPEGTTLEETARVTKAFTRYVAAVPEVRDYQAYVGTASPFDFNGLVRHYFLRDQPTKPISRSTLYRKTSAEPKVTRSPDACGRRCSGSQGTMVPMSKSWRSRPARRCNRCWWRRSTAPTTNDRSPSRARSSASSRARRASRTSTTPSRRTRSNTVSRWIGPRRRWPAFRRRTSSTRCAWRWKAPRSVWRTYPPKKSRCRSSCACRRRSGRGWSTSARSG